MNITLHHGPEHVLHLIKPKKWSERILQDSPMPESPPFSRSLAFALIHLGSTEEVYIYRSTTSTDVTTIRVYTYDNLRLECDTHSKCRIIQKHKENTWPGTAKENEVITKFLKAAKRKWQMCDRTHQILTCINAEPAKVRESIILYGPKCWNMFKRFQKYLGIKFTSLGPTSNVCNLRRSGSADLLVKQLQRLCVFMWWRQVALYFLVRKSATGRKKTTASTMLGRVVFKYLACSRGFSFQLINH